MQPAPQDIQLMSKRLVLTLKPQLRLEWRDQDGQNEKEQPYHSASLGDSIAPSRRIGFSVHTSPKNIGETFGMRFSDRGLEYWSEWQDLNLRSPRPERGAPTISKRKSPEATHVAERHR